MNVSGCVSRGEPLGAGLSKCEPVCERVCEPG